MPQIGSVPSKLVQLNHITDWGLGAKPLLLDNFCDISEKNSRFNAIRIKFRIFLEPFKKLNWYNLKAIKNSSALSIPTLFTGQVQNSL